MDFRKNPLLLLLAGFLFGAAASAAPLKSEYRIHAPGLGVPFVIATDEIQTAGQSRPEKITAQADAEAVRQYADKISKARGAQTELVLYPKGAVRTEFSRRILTRDVLVHLEPGTDARRLANSVGARFGRGFDFLADHFLLSAAETGGALALAESLQAQPGVISAEPQLKSLKRKKLLPNDTYFTQQWHLRNIGQNGGTPGIDVNVTNVWNTYRGSNIVIGIVDDGLQYTHPDLAPNYLAALSWNFNATNSDPAPDVFSDFHGTSVAGVAAARGNNSVGVCGAAFEAKLAGLRLLGGATSDETDAAAMLHSNTVIHIKNNSWGAIDCPYGTLGGTVLDGARPLMKAALSQGVATGRGGKGEIYVFAGGNGGGDCSENVNYDGYANSVDVFAIGAVSDQGFQADYSESGACLVAVTPSGSASRPGITTTDLVGNNGYNYNLSPDLSNRDYTQTFSGTSSATPLASGVMALVLQANTNLSYRDMKEIILRSSRKIQPTDSDWKTNSAGIPHNHKFGAGLMNAQAAVNLATNWGLLDPVTNISSLQTNLNLAIPDNNPLGITRTFNFTNGNFRVEHVTLALTAPHTNWGDLAVTLTSPSGTQSRLTMALANVDIGYQYEGWVLNTVRHWGEKANGNWTVRVADVVAGNTGTLQALDLKLYGSTPQAHLSAVRTNSNVRLDLQAAAPGWTYAIEASSNFLNWATITNLAIPTSGKTNAIDTLAFDHRFYRAKLLP
jgi:subtilisin-like proprotein convertase family protein